MRGPQETSRTARATRIVARNTTWNVIGVGLPLVLAVVTIPVLIRNLGTERFGVLMIAWVVLGYFGLFDLGLGRATTKFLAEDFERGRAADARALFWTSLLSNVALGILGGLVLGALAHPLVDRVLNVPPALRPETLGAFYLVAAAVPLVNVATAARGVLEARHSFGLLNVLHVPTATMTQIAPLLVLPFSTNLTWLVGALALSRLLGATLFVVAALRQIEMPFKGPFLERERLRALFTYGGWLTVSNVIGPLMVYADRFFIGSLGSMSAVTYYATPYEAVTRLWILPHSLTRTVFPIFAADTPTQQRAHIYQGAVKYLALALAPIVATIIVFAPDLLHLWVGETFAKNSTLVLQILAVGVLINSLALVPFTLVQGVGRPDITAKFHLLEFPFYLFLLWYGVQYWGIVGAAMAWTVRVSVDGGLLALYVRLSKRLGLFSMGTRVQTTLALTFVMITGGWALSQLAASLVLKTTVWMLFLVAAAYATWQNVLTPHEQGKCSSFVRTMVTRVSDKHTEKKLRGRDR